jgi:hypothetical protein
MAALRTRTRAVVFRLTPDEYEVLKAACCGKGMNNFSEFARSELLSRSGRGVAEHMLQTQLSEISGQLMKLELLLQDVCHTMNQTAAACQSARLLAAQEGI